jgi:hypothetical protein
MENQDFQERLENFRWCKSKSIGRGGKGERGLNSEVRNSGGLPSTRNMKGGSNDRTIAKDGAKGGKGDLGERLAADENRRLRGEVGQLEDRHQNMLCMVHTQAATLESLLTNLLN